jgi:hypothetical protein
LYFDTSSIDSRRMQEKFHPMLLILEDPRLAIPS